MIRILMACVFSMSCFTAVAQDNQEEPNHYVMVDGNRCLVGCGGLVCLPTGELVPQEYLNAKEIDAEDDFVYLCDDMSDKQKWIFEQLAANAITAEQAEEMDDK